MPKDELDVDPFSYQFLLHSTMLNVGIVLFDDVELLDFAGPFEVFSVTKNQKFNVFAIAEKEEITTVGGLSVKRKYSFENAPAIDIIVVPGGLGARSVQYKNQVLLDWLIERRKTAQLVMSVCTGAFILAEAGFLKGLKATTHWASLDRFEKTYPDTTVVSGVKYVDEGSILTSGGISAGIEGALYAVSKFEGKEAALRTAKIMEYDTILK